MRYYRRCLGISLIGLRGSLRGEVSFSWWFFISFFLFPFGLFLRFRLSSFFVVVFLFSLFVSNFYSSSLSSFSSLMFVFYDVSSMLLPYQLFFCSPSLLPVSSLPCRVFFLLSFCVLHTPSLSSLSFSSLVVSLVFRRYYCFISGSGFHPSFLSLLLLPASLSSLSSFLLRCCLFLSSSLSWFRPSLHMFLSCVYFFSFSFWPLPSSFSSFFVLPCCFSLLPLSLLLRL